MNSYQEACSLNELNGTSRCVCTWWRYGRRHFLTLASSKKIKFSSTKLVIFSWNTPLYVSNVKEISVGVIGDRIRNASAKVKAVYNKCGMFIQCKFKCTKLEILEHNSTAVLLVVPGSSQPINLPTEVLNTKMSEPLPLTDKWRYEAYSEKCKANEILSQNYFKF